MRTSVPILLSVVLIGCSPPPEAPSELSDLAGFLFERFDDNRTDDLALGLENLESWLSSNLGATTGDTVLGGYSVKELEISVLESVRPGVEVSAEEAIRGVAVATESTCGVPGIAQAITVDEQEDVFPSMEVHERTFLDGEACFLDRDCDFLDTDNYVESNFDGLLRTTTESRAQYRWIDYGAAGDRTALIHRTWLQTSPITEGLLADLFELREQIYIGVTLPWEDGAVRLGTTWVSVRIFGGDEDFALNQMVNGMRNDSEAIDEYLVCPGVEE